MSSADSVKELAGRPWPNGERHTWVYLGDLPTPPEVPPLVEETCRKYGFWRKKHKESITRELKLLSLFPGKEIAYKETPQGMLLLLVAEPLSAEMDAFLNGMPRSERTGVYTWYVFDSDDKVSYLFT